MPAAWGNHQYGDAGTVQISPEAFERAVAAQTQATRIVSPDVFERAVAANLASQSVAQPNPRPPSFWNYDPQTGATIADASPGVAPEDLAALYGAEGSGSQLAGKADRPSPVRDPWLAQERRNQSLEAHRAALAASTPATSSGDKLEWRQIGIGVAAGILLAAGLFLGLRTVRIRPLAH